MRKVWFVELSECLLAATTQRLQLIMPLYGCENRLIIARTCLRRSNREAYFVGHPGDAFFDGVDDAVGGLFKGDWMIERNVWLEYGRDGIELGESGNLARERVLDRTRLRNQP